MAVVGSSQSSITDGKAALISKTHKAALTKNGLRIVAPTWIPRGFKLDAFKIETNKEAALRYLTYSYVIPGSKAKFYLQFASDGIGDPFFDLPNGDTLDPTGYLKGKNSVIGSFQLDYVKKPGILMWHITWYETKQSGFPKYVMVAGSNCSPEDGKRIIESLRWLK